MTPQSATGRMTSAESTPAADRVLRMALAGVSLLALAAFAGVALARIGYPYELEWIEGGMRETVRRVLAGQPLYVAPSIEYVPFLYPPLYFYACALVARVTGEGFAALRAVSLVASLGSIALIARLASRGGSGAGAGLIAAGLFAAAYAKGGAWLDLGRVDALFLALTLGAIAMLSRARAGFGRGAVAGALFGLAYLTKQPAALIALPFAALLAFEDRRGLAGLVMAFAGVAGGIHLALDRASGGWYSFYALEVPRAHRIEPAAVTGFWLNDLIALFAIAIAFAIAGFLEAAFVARGVKPAARSGHERTLQSDRRFGAALAIGLIGAAWVSRMHEGGAENVLLPAYAALAILGARGLARISGAGLAVPASRRTALTLALVQFAVLAYNPLRYVPGRADVEAGAALVNRIRALHGDVWSPGHGYLATIAGKESHAHLMAVIDVLRAAPRSRPVHLQQEIEQSFAARRFTALVLDDNQAFEPRLAGLYRPAARLFEPGDRTFLPRSGAPLRPQTLWLPEAR